MTIRVLRLFLLALVCATTSLTAQSPAGGQPAVVDSAELMGLPRDRLSPDLLRAIDALAGATFDRGQVSALLTRIESEVPGTTAAVREVEQAQGRLRITLVVMRVNAEANGDANVNRQYTVGRVEVVGFDEARLSVELRDTLKAIVGRTLEESEADALAARIAAEASGTEEVLDHEVEARMARGSDQGELDVTFVVRRTESSRWMPFLPTASKLVYHRRQGWSGAFDIPIGMGRHRVALGLVRGNNDDRVEEYNGYSLRFETREVATKRLGVGLEFARYTPDWRASTVEALTGEADAPGRYDRRTTITPTATVALTRTLRVRAGISASDLRLPATPTDVATSTQATAWLIQTEFDRRLRDQRELSHRITLHYDWQGGRESLGSDLIYDRHVGSARYDVYGQDSRLSIAFQTGRLSGDAPLFARFTLGDTHSLRGWDKYVIAPAGGNRVVHNTVEYGYKWLRYFVDAGSVWQSGAERRFRVSTGVGFDSGVAFITVGVPLNGGSVTPTVILGLRSRMTFGHSRLD